MKLKPPKIRGKKTKSIRVDLSELKLLREELKDNKEWADYAEALDSELVRLAIMFARLHMQPDVFMLTTDAVQTLVNEAVQLNIGEVAAALGGVAQMNPDGTISVTRPMSSDSIKTFKAKPPTKKKPTFIH